MKIKNLKYMFVVLLFLSVSPSIVFGACKTKPSVCSAGDSGSDDWFNNGISITDTGSLVYLKQFHPNISNPLQCSNNNASTAADNALAIQKSMSGNCDFNGCQDGRFGPITEGALKNCMAVYCSKKGGKAPTLSGDGNLKCDDPLYKLDNEDTKCCISDACNILYGENYIGSAPDENGLCADGLSKDTLYDCCIKVSEVCGSSETGYVNLRSISVENTGLKCLDCGFGRKPSEDRLKCVCNAEEACCGIELYVGIPFIGNCIEMNSDSSRPDTTTVTNTSAFPVLMQGLMKVLMSVILVVSFLLVIVSGLMMTAGAFKSTSFDKGKTLIKNVIISLILLGLSGLILKLINPSFFGG